MGPVVSRMFAVYRNIMDADRAGPKAPPSASPSSEARLREIFTDLAPGSCSKSVTRAELRERLCPRADSGDGGLLPAEPAFMETLADAHYRPEVYCLDGSGAMGCLRIHSPPPKNVAPTEHDLERFSSNGALVEWFVKQIKGPFASTDRAIHTVVMAMDESELVAPGKGAEQYGRAKGKSSSLDNWTAYVRDTHGQTLEQYHGAAFFDPLYTSVDETERDARVQDVNAAIAAGAGDLHQLMAKKRKLLARTPLSKLLVRDKPIPGPFERLYGDRVRGRPALLRFLVKSAAADAIVCCYLQRAQRVLISGHCLLPEDLYTSDVVEGRHADYLDFANEVATTPVLLHNPDDLETVELFLGEACREKLERERHEVPMRETGLPRLAVLDPALFGHANGEADQGLYFFVRALSEHLNFQAFELRSVDTDNVFSGPMFLAERYVMAGGKRMPAIYNDFDSHRGGPKSDPRNICAVHALLAAIQRHLYAEVPYFQAYRLREQQVSDSGSGMTALLSHAKVQPERARHEDALYAAVDTSGDHFLEAAGAQDLSCLDKSVPMEAHFVAMMILAGTDFCKGWYFIGASSLFDAFQTYSHQCMPLVRRSTSLLDEEGRGILEYEPRSVLRLVLYMYVTKRVGAFRKRRPEELRTMSAVEIVEAIVRFQLAKYDREMGALEREGVDKLPDDLKAVHSAVAKCIPSTEELVARLLNANYYLAILSQTGLATIRYRREQYAGYKQRAMDKTLSRSNIRHSYS